MPPETPPPADESIFALLIPGLGGLLLIGVLGYGALNLVVSTKGPGYCARYFEEQYPELANSAAVSRWSGVWTHRQGDHWVSALLASPFDLEEPRYTVVCQFGSTNYTDGPVTILSGDKRARLKETSDPIWIPSAW